ncbi:MAG: PH domain-containing protein [Chloroflexia bacterium]|nr:PH domain-containing protein [Chloroflexia bacterium]
MAINFFCSACGGQLTIDDAHAGKWVQCPLCSQNIQVPQAGAAPPPAPQPRLAPQPQAQPPAPAAGPSTERTMWTGRPSIRGRYGAFFGILLMLAIAVFSQVASAAGLFPEVFDVAQDALNSLRSFLIELTGSSISYLSVYNLLSVAMVLFALLKLAGLLLWAWQERYTLTSQRLIVNKGLLAKQKDQILLIRIKDIRLQQSLFDRLFNVGTIRVVSPDETDRIEGIFKISRPDAVFETLHATWQQAIRGKDMVMW